MKVKGQDIKSELELNRTLDTMYALSNEGDEPFYNLIELMLNKQTIITAIHNIKSNKGSKTVGIDKKDINHYLQMREEKLIALIEEKVNNYHPLPVRRQYIPKGNTGKLRPLGIPTLIDRTIQEMARIVLEPIVEAKFFKHSYGFRPYRSTEHAIARILDLIRRADFYYVVEGDIEGFFDNINHNKLIEILWNMGIKDKRYLSIIKKMLKAGIIEEGNLIKSDDGTPQGGIISPILANVYLNGFDHYISEMWEEHYARENVTEKNSGRYLRQKGHVPYWLVRYADDWVILTNSKESAEKILHTSSKYLRHKLKLNLSPDKTLITDVREKPIKFLGFNIIAEKARLKDKIVGKAIPNKEKFDSKVNEVLKDINKLQVFKNDYDRVAHIEYVNSKIVGISNYYSIGNCSIMYKSADNRIDYRAYKTFCKVYGKTNWRSYRLPAQELNNRISRHKGLKTKVYNIGVDDVRIGITRFGFTKSRMAKNFNQEMTPYTSTGRKLYEKESEKKLKLNRPTVYDSDDLKYTALHQLYPSKRSDTLYNFEYMMNRDYAYLRDYGKCKCCKTEVTGFNVHCHHIELYLPKDMVNKVRNLATICKRCHKVIHNNKLEIDDAKTMKKINKYRMKLTEKLAKDRDI